MKTFEEKLKDYGKLIVRKGINVDKGQPVRINCPLEQVEFGKILAREAYKAGASEVIIDWLDDELNLLKFENAPMEVLEEFPQWKVDKAEYYYKKNVASISVSATDPELLKDIDPKKVAAANKAASIANKDIMKYPMNDICSWCVVSAATEGWARKVFPDLEGEEAVMKLWDQIFYATRADREDPIAAWDGHVARLQRAADFLNESDFKYLEYKNQQGTDLRVELPAGYIFLSAVSKNERGRDFIANIPTEEVYSLPKRDGVNGSLVSTKPLNYNGNLIDGMKFEFKDGAVVDFSAELGQEHLEALLTVDENAKYLGEVALVAHDSPISNQNILFMNTLYDENASCHFAFGKAYPTNIESGTEMNEEELLAAGVNDSLIHVDFMVGSEDLDIVGIKKDGQEVKIFENGNWAF